MLGLAVAGTALAATTDTGPSTTTDPYVIPVADGVKTSSLLTVKNGSDPGEASNGYAMVGIPDGLGALDGPRGRDFNLIMNHELRGTQGVNRRHGVNGAFDSIWTIDSKTLEVEEGSDLLDPGIRYYDYTTHSYAAAPTAPFTAQLNRLCSGYLTAPGQLWNGRTDRGYNGQIYFANEENGDIGRDFGVTMDGQAQQLPRLGLLSWENSLVGLNEGDVTYLQGQEDGRRHDERAARLRRSASSGAGTRSTGPGSPTATSSSSTSTTRRSRTTPSSARRTARTTRRRSIWALTRRSTGISRVPRRHAESARQGPRAEPHRGRSVRPASSGGLLLRDDERGQWRHGRP